MAEHLMCSRPLDEMRYTHVMSSMKCLDKLESVNRNIRRIPGRLWLIVVCLVTYACQRGNLLKQISVRPNEISLDSGEVVEVQFRLRQPAEVKIFLAGDENYNLRSSGQDITYPAGKHTFSFDGVVQGYSLPGETYPFEIVRRLVPAGVYHLVVTATSGDSVEEAEKLITVLNNPYNLPVISEVVVDPPIITPNDDGVDDAAKISFDLRQDVDDVKVYAVSPSGTAYPIPEIAGQSRPNERGEHIYHFDALEQVGEQIQDEVFVIHIDIYDVYGQHIRWKSGLEIRDTGKLSAFILDGVVTYELKKIDAHQALCFILTVSNNSETYLRTSGPWPATTYHYPDNFVTMQFPEDKGIYRIGMDFETAEGQYPFRWALGTPDAELVQIDGEWFLPPYTNSAVSGCVDFNADNSLKSQYVWMGLLHEQSLESLINHRVAPYYMELSPGTE